MLIIILNLHSRTKSSCWVRHKLHVTLNDHHDRHSHRPRRDTCRFWREQNGLSRNAARSAVDLSKTPFSLGQKISDSSVIRDGLISDSFCRYTNEHESDAKLSQIINMGVLYPEKIGKLSGSAN